MLCQRQFKHVYLLARQRAPCPKSGPPRRKPRAQMLLKLACTNRGPHSPVVNWIDRLDQLQVPQTSLNGRTHISGQLLNHKPNMVSKRSKHPNHKGVGSIHCWDCPLLTFTYLNQPPPPPKKGLNKDTHTQRHTSNMVANAFSTTKHLPGAMG